MPIHSGRIAAALLVLSLSPLGSSRLAAQAAPTHEPPTQVNEPSAPDTTTAPPAAGYADLTLGGYSVLRLRGAAGGLSPEDRISVIMGRLTPLLGVPNIHPSDIVVFLPAQTSHVNRSPVIYALGRRLITVDPATVKAAGGGDPLTVATRWAKRLQQVLPRVNWRPSNAPDPKVLAHPPLTITKDFTQVGGQIGVVSLRGKIVMKMRGPQEGGLTAAERADMLTARLEHLANNPAASAPDGETVTPQPDGSAQLVVAGTPLVTVTAADAQAEGLATPLLLADSWAKNLRAVLNPPVPVTPPPADTPPAPPAAPAPPTGTTPAPPAAPPAPTGT